MSVNSINPDLKSQKTDEIVGGIGHEIFANFAVDIAYTYRKAKDFYFAYKAVPNAVNPAPLAYQLDHTVTGTLPDGTPYSAPIYTLVGGKAVAAANNGAYFTNRPNYTQDFNGVELTANKRLSQGWMMRASAAYNNAKQRVGRRLRRSDQRPLQQRRGHGPRSLRRRRLAGLNAGGGSGPSAT